MASRLLAEVGCCVLIDRLPQPAELRCAELNIAELVYVEVASTCAALPVRPLQPRSQRTERFLNVSCGVCLKGIDADRQVVQAGLVERLDYPVAQEETVGYDARVRFPASVCDELGNVRMHQRLSPEHRDIRRMQAMQSIDSLLEHIRRHGFREVVVFGAVTAAQVAATGDDQLRVEWSVREENAGDCA